MGALEEITKMQQEGKSDQEIIQNLRSAGFSDYEISDALAQSRIKEAVSAPSSAEMQPSVFVPSDNPSEKLYQQSEVPYPEQGQMQEQYAQQEYSQYPQYDAQAQQEIYDPSQQQYAQYSSISPDTITEIAEQVIQDRLSETQNKLQQIASFKATIEAQIEYIDDRLKKIEKIIDRLQLSILQKVGEYVTNVDDLKKEVIETQKSFKSLIDKHHSSQSQKHSEK